MTAAWHLTRYRDVRAALSDPQFEIYKPLGGQANHIRERECPCPQRSPRISLLSRVLSEHLSARSVNPLAPKIEALVETCIVTANVSGGLDIVADLAWPLPLTIMADLLGLPAKEFSQLRPLFDAISRGHDMGATMLDRQQAQFAILSIGRWLARLLPHRHPALLMDAIMSTAKAEHIDESMVLYWCTMLLYAGSITTKDLIANAIGTLLEFPEQARLLASQPDLMGTALEELLRYEGPIRGIGRVANDDVVIGDCQIKHGQLVYLMLAEANRDPEHFRAPHELDLRRQPNPHLAFGQGVTYCLGAHLARLETRLVLARILPHLARMRMQSPATWTDSRLLRQRSALRVTFH